MIDRDKQVQHSGKTTEEHIAEAKAKIIAVPIPCRKDWEVSGKVGRKPLVVNEVMLDQIYRVVLSGAVEDVNIWPVLGISKASYYNLKRNNPIIEETIAAAYAERSQLVDAMLNNVLFNPDHRDHSKALMDHKNRETRRWAKLQKLQVEIVDQRPIPGEDLPVEKLLQHLDDLNISEGEIEEDE